MMNSRLLLHFLFIFPKKEFQIDMSILTTYQSQVESKSLKVDLNITIDTIRHRYIKNLASLTTLIKKERNSAYCLKTQPFEKILFFKFYKQQNIQNLIFEQTF